LLFQSEPWPNIIVEIAYTESVDHVFGKVKDYWLKNLSRAHDAIAVKIDPVPNDQILSIMQVFHCLCKIIKILYWHDIFVLQIEEQGEEIFNIECYSRNNLSFLSIFLKFLMRMVHYFISLNSELKMEQIH